jgi:hypothetical protein
MNIDEKMLAKAEVKRGMLDKLFQYASRGLVEDEDSDAEELESVAEDPI